MNVGQSERARDVLRRALGATWDVDQPTEAADLLPRIFHRIGQAHAMDGELESALKCFIEAEERFQRNNVVGRAMVLRDHGLVVWEHVSHTEGERLVREAVKVLKQTSKADPRWELEYIVTQGFLARLRVSKKPQESLKTFLKVDEYVRGGSKWVYELDNLEQIIPLLPRSERPVYLMRASLLSLRMVTAQEVSQVGNELMDGRLLTAPLGCLLRSASRLPRAIVDRTRAMI